MTKLYGHVCDACDKREYNYNHGDLPNGWTEYKTVGDYKGVRHLCPNCTKRLKLTGEA